MQSIILQFVVLLGAVIAMWTVTAAPLTQVAEKINDAKTNEIQTKAQKSSPIVPKKTDSSEIHAAAQANISKSAPAPVVPASVSAAQLAALQSPEMSPNAHALEMSSDQESSERAEEESQDRNDGQEMDDEQYLEALLSDPRLVREMRQQEQEQRELEELEQERDLERMYPGRSTSSNFVLTPLAMAEYLLVSGDLAGVVKIVRDLVADGSLTIEEAKSYEAAIEAEYAILTGKDDDGSDYIQQNKRYSDEILQSVDSIPDYGSNFDYQGFAQAPEELPADSDINGAYEQNQIAPNYEEMLQNLLDTIEMEQRNGNSAEQDIQTSQSNAELEALNPDSRFSLEEELEALPAAAVHEDGKSASNSEMSVEDELALLSKTSSEQKNKQDSHTNLDLSPADVLHADNVHEEKQNKINHQIKEQQQQPTKPITV